MTTLELARNDAVDLARSNLGFDGERPDLSIAEVREELRFLYACLKKQQSQNPSLLDRIHAYTLAGTLPTEEYEGYFRDR